MKHSFLLLLSLLCSAVLADVSYLRVINAFQSTSLRVEGTGSIVIGSLSFGQATDYIEIPINQQISLQVFNAANNNAVAGPLTFNLAASNPVRWLSWVITENATTALLVDNPSVPSNQVFVRVVPLFTAQNLLINSQINGQSVVLVTTNLPALSPSSVNLYTYRVVPAGRATWTVTSASPAIAASITIELTAGNAYTFLVLQNSVFIVLDRSSSIGAATTAVATTLAATTQAATTLAATTQAVTTLAATTQAVTTLAATTQVPVTQTFTQPTIVVVTTDGGQQTVVGPFIPIIPATGGQQQQQQQSGAATSSVTFAITHFVLLLLAYRFGLF